MAVPMWIVRSMASVVALTLLASAAQAQILGTQPKPAAVVNGEPITLAEVDAVLKLGGPSPAQITDAQRRQMRTEVVEEMIDRMVLRQYLRKNGPRVDPNEVNKKLTELE